MRNRAVIVPLIIFLNIVVFILWSNADRSEVPAMVDNFMISWSALSEGRYWTLLTAAFSHHLVWHIFLNMFVLFSFGSDLEITLGRRSFTLFYLTAAVFSSFAHAFVSAYYLNAPDVPALGASGAVAGVILVFSLLNPGAKILLMGLIPMPALFGAFLFIGLDVWGLMAQSGGGGLPIGHGAHLGGALIGIIYYFLFVRNRRLSR